MAGGQPTPGANPLHNAKKFARLLDLGEFVLFGSELLRVDAATAATHFDRMLQVQHFMEQNVLNRIPWYARMIEDAADDDGIVRRIVVPKAAAGVVLAPCKLRTAHQPVEETPIEVVEDFFQMIVLAASGADVLPTARLTPESSPRHQIVASDITAITGAVLALDRLTIKLGKQNMGD